MRHQDFRKTYAAPDLQFIALFPDAPIANMYVETSDVIATEWDHDAVIIW